MSADIPEVREAAFRQSDALFGRQVSQSAIQVSPIARSTRSLYQVRVAGTDLPVIVAKRRPFRTAEERNAAQTQTAYECALLCAVSSAMRTAGVPGHSVPQALGAVPEAGLLFMARVPGTPVIGPLRKWLIGFNSLARACDLLRQCGGWLHTFTKVAPAVAWPTVGTAEAAILRAGRDRHHVYCLLGLSGSDLLKTALEQMRRRLTAYRVDAGSIHRIESAFSNELVSLDGTRDLRGNVHGKYSLADVLVDGRQVAAVDLEQAGHGSLYLDAAYFLYQTFMVTRWRPFGRDRGPALQLRRAFLRARCPDGELDDAVLDCLIGYYLVNSLRPGDGIAGAAARAYARRWIEEWLQRAGA